METLRKSSYIISVKLDTLENEYILVHGYTGTIDIVSEEIMNYFESGQPITENSFPFSTATFKYLKRRGYITRKSEAEEQSYVKKLAYALHEYNRNRPNFTFVVAYDCNFRCPYCFEKEVLSKSKHWSKQVFSKEMVDKAYQLIENIFQKGNGYENKEIKLYGGEPLLAANKEIVNYIVQKGVKLGCHFYAITNGYDLDSYLDLTKPGLIDRLQITIDGTKEYHDNRRIHFKNKESFDKIIHNIKEALIRNIQITVRMNTDMNNIDSLGELKKTFQDAGFYNHKNFSIYSAILDGQKNENQSNCLNMECDFTENNNEITYLNYREYYDKLTGNNYDIETNDISIKNILTSIRESKPLPVHSTNCGAQTGMYILDPYGDIYTCLKFVGCKEHIIGNYMENLSWNSDCLSIWRNRNIGTVEQCSKCKYSLFCGGGCLAKHLARNGNLNASFCNHFPYAFNANLQKAYNKMFL
ncbi:MAG: SPASM domain-containing protein [Bacteroidales bacterium]|jgi:uncharacterized protein|nr:SPASM domain-containing protein [Bacteroidales bacterium]